MSGRDVSTTTGYDALTDVTAEDRDPLSVDLDVFSGPIEVLLELITRRHIEITEISIAQIVDDFIQLAEQAGRLQLDAASKFLLVAATLIQIKTRRLLPIDEEIEIDEELLADAERDVLLARLLAAKTFADVAAVLRDALAEGERYRPRAVAPEPHLRKAAPDVLAQATPVDLARIALHVLADKPEPEFDIGHIQPVRVSVAGAVAHLTAILPQVGETTYRTVCAGMTRIDAVVAFLAILELVKAGVVRAEQTGLRDDIGLCWVPGAPLDAINTEDWDMDVTDEDAAEVGDEADFLGPATADRS